MRASIKMIGVSNLQSFIASMTQKLTLSDISDKSTLYPYTTLFRSRCAVPEQRGRLGYSTRRDNPAASSRSEEHTSELQSPVHRVCRLLLEKENYDDKSAQIYVRFDTNYSRIQPAEFYRFHDAEVNT